MVGAWVLVGWDQALGVGGLVIGWSGESCDGEGGLGLDIVCRYGWRRECDLVARLVGGKGLRHQGGSCTVAYAWDMGRKGALTIA